MKKMKITAIALLLALGGLAGCGPQDNPQGGGSQDGGNTDVEDQKTLTSISLDTTSVKKVFEKGDTFNSDGLVVTATYSDGSTGNVTTFQVSNPNMTTASEDVTVTVSFTFEGVTKTATYSIEVKEPVVFTSLSLDTENVTREFNVNEEFNAEGLVVTANFSNGTTKTLNAGEFTVEAPDMSVAGNPIVVTVKATIDGVEQETSYNISIVVPVTLTGFALDTSEVKTEFALGQSFNSDGLIVTAVYSNDTEVDLDSEENEEFEYEVLEPDMTTTGEKTVSVNIKDSTGTVVATETYTINISYWTETDLANMEKANSFILYGDAAFPYVNGAQFNLLDEETGEWSITKANATLADVNALGEAIKKFRGSFVDDWGDTVTIGISSFTRLPEGAAEYAGIKENSGICLLVTPYYVDSGYKIREYTSDEYIVIGLDNDNNLKVVDRYVGTYGLDSVLGLYLGMEIGYSCSEASYFNSKSGIGELSYNAVGLFTLPQVTEEGLILSEGYPYLMYDNKYLNPFDLSLDSLDFSVEYGVPFSTNEMRTAYLNALQANGFALATQKVEKDGETWDVLTIDDEYIGTFTVRVAEYDAEYFAEDDPDTEEENEGIEGYSVDVDFTAPSVNFTKEQTFLIKNVADVLGIESIEFEGNSFVASLSVSEGTSLDCLDLILSRLNPDDTTFTVTSKSEEVDEYGIACATMNDGNFVLEISARVAEVGDALICSLYFEARTYTPASLTVKTFADVIGEIFKVQMEKQGDDEVYVGTDTSWANDGYDARYGASIIEQVFANKLPDYVDLFKEYRGASLIEEGPLADGTRRFSSMVYHTNDGRFQVEILAYDVYKDPTAQTKTISGVNIQFIVSEPRVKPVPAGKNAMIVASEISTKLFGEDYSHYDMINGCYTTDFDSYFSNLYNSSVAGQLFNVYYEDVLDTISSYVPYYFDYVEELDVVDEEELFASKTYLSTDGTMKLDVQYYIIDGQIFGGKKGTIAGVFEITVSTTELGEPTEDELAFADLVSYKNTAMQYLFN